ncbi:response regulator transcription factor [Ottowia testudinis]|uniref:Response regulator transcription factor n=1 Tax=Ottowia testudinis TaxID=2816950 RepID=A0A975CFM9_9BURK|nr:response regulator transcription factor [Ottowia testudinis]QTD44901.1 response regulator transcription factor [Ottowia testudinis]
MNALLVVEDLPDIRAWLVDAARIAFPDCEVVAVGRCREGVAEVMARRFNVALIDLELPDGSGVAVIQALRNHQPQAVSVVVTIHDDDDHLFPALQAGAFGYLLKESPRDALVVQLQRMTQGEPPLSPSIARRVLNYFSSGGPRGFELGRFDAEEVALNARETEILQRVAKGYTLPEIAGQLGLSRHTVADYVKQIYRKLNVSSRAEAALEAARRGLVR